MFPDATDLIGGHPALDLVNTVTWRHDPARVFDRVTDFPALTRWAVASGLVDRPAADRLDRRAAADPPAAARALRANRRLRETLHELLTGMLDGGAPDPAALGPFLLDAVRHASLAPFLPLRWSVSPRVPEDLVHLLTLVVAELLGDPEPLSALRLCEGAGCGWLFIDRSRSHTRRWCAAGDCGNRERARRHYARTRAARAATR